MRRLHLVVEKICSCLYVHADIRESFYCSTESLEKELDDANFKERMYRKTSDLATWSTDPVRTH